ncbi:DNA adenine methyltransferase [hydrothermal vent metagenome]|uniref:DNA adenine methyltransferase n=1 Tax=hydrothermal vent metagenome TaxID=652676 RepID=A0A3B1E0J8_9ZZZZ
MVQMRRLPVDQLLPAPYNPRKALQPGSDEYNRLERSLKEFDLVQPIVWNEQTKHVVGGHQRLSILKNWGEADIDVVVVSLTLEREKALNVALNNSQVGGDWDSDKLIDLLTDLNDNTEIDATLTGFDKKEINNILFIPALLPEEETEEEEELVVRVTIEVPHDNWEAVRPDFDHLIATHHLTTHIQLP